MSAATLAGVRFPLSISRSTPSLRGARRARIATMGRSRTDPATSTRAGLAFRWPDLVFVATLGWLAVALVLTVTNRHATGRIDPLGLVASAGLAATSTIGWIILRRTGNPIGWITSPPSA